MQYKPNRELTIHGTRLAYRSHNERLWGKEMMLKNIVESAAVEKLKGIISHRYGKGLSIQCMQEASDIDMGEESVFMKGHSLHISIQVNEKYFATAVIKEASSLSQADQLALAYMVRMVLEPEFYNWYLTQTANNSQNSEQQDNVVSIFTPHDLTEYLDEKNEEIEEESFEPETVICLEAKNPHLIPRLAYEIHEVSQRWAFLKYSDIQEQVRNVQDLISLGSLTLMVEDVLTLSPEHQQIIEQFLKNSEKTEKPLLVIGTSSHIESLEDQGMIAGSFAELLKAHRLEADRLPRDQKLLQETLEFVLHI